MFIKRTLLVNSGLKVMFQITLTYKMLGINIDVYKELFSRISILSNTESYFVSYLP